MTQGEKTPGGNMSKADEKAAREQRLAAKLRENLKRRKGQARMRASSAADTPVKPPDAEPNGKGS